MTLLFIWWLALAAPEVHSPPQPSALLEAMQHTLGSEAKIEIVETSRYPVPAGSLEFPLTGLQRTNPDQPMLWRGCLRVSPVRTIPVWARVRLAIERQVVVARTELPAGKRIDATLLALETRGVLPIGEAPLSDLAQASGRTPRHTLKAGEALLSRTLAPSRAVERGDTVKLLVESGSARLSLEAIAESSGDTGQTIVVRNAATGRRVRAEVSGPGAARVVAGGQR